MRRAALAALLALALVASATPVAAHGNHVEVDSQHSADGTVVVEAVRPLTDGFVVLHRATDDGDIGAPVGHTRVDFEDAFQQNVPVEMDADVWADWPANGSLWVVFHADRNQNGEFDPGVDERASAFGASTGQSVTLEKSDEPASVVAERAQAQQTATATATVDSVVLPEDGFVVLRTDSGTDGRVVGTKALTAGATENVSVDIDPSVFSENQSTVGLYAQLYTDNGDGEFSANDSLVRAGDSPVSTYFLVWQVDEVSTPSEPVVRTPTSDDGVVTPTATATDAEDATTGESGSAVPGFGVVVALVALTLAALARR
ncbi:MULTISPECIES: PGF-CTERM sorting domain-containing protein [Halobacterium]|uniref:DUF7282 domain-containing protein n=1 Tax=Halobacterium TaxID=2239 RepID=UPI00073ED314|nr:MULTISPECIES: PGF-CTERM sorting domain-containing protein [Halobacterium]MCG1002832.1 PGF-CTERM sorting domain-containing protein [Halobacterium noricense]